MVMRRTLGMLVMLLGVLALLAVPMAALLINTVGAPEPDREVVDYEVRAGGLVDLPADTPVQFGVPGDTENATNGQEPPTCEVTGPSGESLAVSRGFTFTSGNTFWRFGHATTTEAGEYTIMCDAFADELTAKTYPWSTADREAEERGRKVLIVSVGLSIAAAVLVFGGAGIARSAKKRPEAEGPAA